MEYRLCSGRHDANVHFVGERESGANPDVALYLHCGHFHHLSDRRVDYPRDQGKFPLKCESRDQKGSSTIRNSSSRKRPVRSVSIGDEMIEPVRFVYVDGLRIATCVV